MLSECNVALRMFARSSGKHQNLFEANKPPLIDERKVPNRSTFSHDSRASGMKQIGVFARSSAKSGDFYRSVCPQRRRKETGRSTCPKKCKTFLAAKFFFSCPHSKLHALFVCIFLLVSSGCLLAASWLGRSAICTSVSSPARRFHHSAARPCFASSFLGSLCFQGEELSRPRPIHFCFLQLCILLCISFGLRTTYCSGVSAAEALRLLWSSNSHILQLLSLLQRDLQS